MTDIEEINFDEFIEAEKAHAGVELDPQIVRISTAVVLGRDVSAALVGRELNQDDKIVLKIQYNPIRKMLRLTKVDNPRDGFIFGTDKNATTFSSNNLPRSIKDLKVARGEYEPVPGHDDVFVWVREFRSPFQVFRAEAVDPAKEFYEEDTDNIAYGDIVSWIYRGHKDENDEYVPDSFGTGEVVGVSAENFQIQGLSKNTVNRTNKTTVVKRNKVILRRKYDAK